MESYISLSDNELLDLLKKDEEGAFTEIYYRYWKLLFEKANTVLHDSDAAQDAVQEVFISLWDRKGKVNIVYLKGYLQQAIRFKVFNYIREERTDEQFYVRLRNVTTEIISENPTLFKEQEDLLNTLIDSLPADCKEAFKLSRQENLTYKQIAEQLNISIKTVEKRISKSLKHIRQHLDVKYCISILLILGNI